MLGQLTVLLSLVDVRLRLDFPRVNDGNGEVPELPCSVFALPLSSVCAGACFVTAEGLSRMGSRLSSLVLIDVLAAPGVTYEHVGAALSRMTVLRELRLHMTLPRRCRFGPPGIVACAHAIAALPRLLELELTGMPLGEAAGHLGGATQLTALRGCWRAAWRTAASARCSCGCGACVRWSCAIRR